MARPPFIKGGRRGTASFGRQRSAAGPQLALGVPIGNRDTLEGELIGVADMPSLPDGPANRPSISGALFAAAMRRWPAHAELFARECEHDRAEAALFAVTGLIAGEVN